MQVKEVIEVAKTLIDAAKPILEAIQEAAEKLGKQCCDLPRKRQGPLRKGKWGPHFFYDISKNQHRSISLSKK